MAVPTSISDCNATAANNSPAGSDSIGTSLDDYLRSHAAIIRQVYDYTLANMLPLSGGTVTGQIKGITPVANADLARKDYVDSLIISGTTASGTYTPSITAYQNVNTSSVPAVFSYIRVGNNVTVCGLVNITPTSANLATAFYMTLPVASALTSDYQGSGVANASNAGGSSAGFVQASSFYDKATVYYKQVNNTNAMEVYVNFMYQII